jgi:hypothetical protein
MRGLKIPKFGINEKDISYIGLRKKKHQVITQKLRKSNITQIKKITK